MPVINGILKKLNRKGLLVFLILFGFSAYLIDNIFGSPYGGVQKGIEFYCIGAYIKLYSSKKKKPRIHLVVLIISWIICTCLYYFMNFCLANENQIKYQVIYVALLWILSSGPVIACSVSLFLWAQCLHFHSLRINCIAKTTFGIYLIHEGLFARWWIWKGLLKVDSIQYFSKFFPLTAIASILIVFGVCSIIDYCRLTFLQPL